MKEAIRFLMTIILIQLLYLEIALGRDLKGIARSLTADLTDLAWVLPGAAAALAAIYGFFFATVEGKKKALDVVLFCLFLAAIPSIIAFIKSLA